MIHGGASGRKAKPEAPSLRPDRTMTVREFLRGGYHGHEGVTIVFNGGIVEGIWIRGGDRLRVDLPESKS